MLSDKVLQKKMRARLAKGVANFSTFMFSGTASIEIALDASFFVRGKVLFKRPPTTASCKKNTHPKHNLVTLSQNMDCGAHAIKV